MVELKSGRKFVIRQKGVVLTLTINSLEKSDTDIYICNVGTMQSRAQLTVQGETMSKGILRLWFRWCSFKLNRSHMVVGLRCCMVDLRVNLILSCQVRVDI